MIKNFINNFKKLPKSNKSLVFLMWIYDFGTIIANIFIVVYIYKINNSLNNLIIYSILNYTFIMIGFAGIGTLMFFFRKNIKYMFYIAYISFILAFLILFIFGENIFGIYLYGIIYGLGIGAFWNGIHTQELATIKDKDRDFYSSSLSVGKNILRILNPFLVSFIFFVALFF